MEVDSASSVRKLTAMFGKNMAEEQKVIRKRSVPEKPEKSSPDVVDGQANNGEAMIVCDTVHMGESAKKLNTEFVSKEVDAECLAEFETDAKFEKVASPKYVQMRKAGKDMRPEG